MLISLLFLYKLPLYSLLEHLWFSLYIFRIKNSLKIYSSLLQILVIATVQVSNTFLWIIHRVNNYCIHIFIIYTLYTYCLSLWIIILNNKYSSIVTPLKPVIQICVYYILGKGYKAKTQYRMSMKWPGQNRVRIRGQVRKSFPKEIIHNITLETWEGMQVGS